MIGSEIDPGMVKGSRVGDFESKKWLGAQWPSLFHTECESKLPRATRRPAEAQEPQSGTAKGGV